MAPNVGVEVKKGQGPSREQNRVSPYALEVQPEVASPGQSTASVVDAAVQRGNAGEPAPYGPRSPEQAVQDGGSFNPQLSTDSSSLPGSSLAGRVLGWWGKKPEGINQVYLN